MPGGQLKETRKMDKFRGPFSLFTQSGGSLYSGLIRNPKQK